MSEGRLERGPAAEYRATALVIFAHVLILVVGFSILAAVFELPEILRQPSTDRLALYRRGRSLIQPTYWALAMSGLTQVAIAVLLHRSFRERDRTVLALALVFGVLAGILQTTGFIRWAILIPYLAEQMAAASPAQVEILALIEGAFNRYAGMALGEHTANVCLGLCTFLVGFAVRRDRLFDRRMGTFGMVLGVVAAGLALEQLGVAPALFEVVMDFGFPAWAVWLVVLAVSLLRTDANTGEGPPLGRGTAAWVTVLYVLLVLPAMSKAFP
jgi:hypothetical protein